jgi:hypothetical protein
MYGQLRSGCTEHSGNILQDIEIRRTCFHIPWIWAVIRDKIEQFNSAGNYSDYAILPSVLDAVGTCLKRDVAARDL